MDSLTLFCGTSLFKLSADFNRLVFCLIQVIIWNEPSPKALFFCCAVVLAICFQLCDSRAYKKHNFPPIFNHIMAANVHLAYGFSLRATDYDSATVKERMKTLTREDTSQLPVACLLAPLASSSQGLLMPLLPYASSQCQGFALHATTGLTEFYNSTKWAKWCEA